MLKLEKIAKTMEISISLRRREGFFNKRLLQALAIALFLHVSAGVLFQVRPFKVIGSQMIFPPIVVDADIQLTPVIAELDKEDTLPRLIREPKSSLPLFPKPGLEIAGTKSAIEPRGDDFYLFEQDIYPIEWMVRQKAKNPIEVTLSGPLAERKLLDDGTDHFKSIFKSGKAVFAVQVDDKTGSIFWYQSKQSQNSIELEQQAERIVRAIRFQEEGDSFVTTGEVEIQFTGAAG